MKNTTNARLRNWTFALDAGYGMNDFTKEELSLLYRSTLRCVDVDRETNIPNVDMLNKLLEMIDNYCEQEKCPNPNCNLSKRPANVECKKYE